jgi:hypothetical protein
MQPLYFIRKCDQFEAIYTRLFRLLTDCQQIKELVSQADPIGKSSEKK